MFVEHHDYPERDSCSEPYESFDAAFDMHRDSLLAVGSGTREVESSMLSEQQLAAWLHVPDFMLEGLEGDERCWRITVNGADHIVEDGCIRPA